MENNSEDKKSKLTRATVIGIIAGIILYKIVFNSGLFFKN
ncbi:MAG: hypothetical protein RL757_2303 [Bacteroidota bacterium]|jgi:hypothetical protein